MLKKKATQLMEDQKRYGSPRSSEPSTLESIVRSFTLNKMNVTSDNVQIKERFNKNNITYSTYEKN